MRAEVIQNNHLFQKLKNIVENNPYHDHETVFDHLLKTYKKAVNEISGNLVTNDQAKDKFNMYLDQEIGGIKKRELIPIIALTHDIGKMLSYEENGETKPIVQTNEDGITKAPGHEYAGSTIAIEVLKEVNLPNEAINYIAKGIRLHGVFNGFWQNNQGLSAQESLEGLRHASEEMHVETIFNALCDNYSAAPFQPALPIIQEILNLPETYTSRDYFVE